MTSTIRPNNPSELRAVVQHAIKTDGLSCDLNHIDVSGITDFSFLFQASDFCGDISGWDVSNGQIMARMFQDSTFNGDISRWNVSRVTNAGAMFSGSRFNGDLSKWNPASLVNAGSMFEDSQFNGDISQWDVSKLRDMGAMFRASAFNGDISRWNVSNASNMGSLFQRSLFNGDISDWDVRSVNNMARMFADSVFTGDLSRWNLACVNNAMEMFARSEFNGSIHSWSLRCQLLQGMFQGAKFSGDLSSWMIPYRADVEGMFSSSFKGVLPQQEIRDSNGPGLRGAFAAAVPAVSPQDERKRIDICTSMFKTRQALHTYLAGVPFGTSHFDVLVGIAFEAFPQTPPWASPADLVWAKDHHDMGLALGMDAQAIRESAVGAYHQRNAPAYTDVPFEHPCGASS